MAIRVTAAALGWGASAGLAGPDAGMAGAALTPALESALGHIFDRIDSRRRKNAAETLTDAADELGAEAPEEFAKFIKDAVSSLERQELLARALTIAQDTAMRDKRRALGRALASAVAETSTTVNEELAFIRVIADLDSGDIRVLRLMSTVPEHLRAKGYVRHGASTTLQEQRREIRPCARIGMVRAGAQMDREDPDNLGLCQASTACRLSFSRRWMSSTRPA